MFEQLSDWLDNAVTKLGRTHVVPIITTSWWSPVELVTQHFTKLFTWHKKPIGTAKTIPDDVMKTHIFTILFESSGITIKVLQLRIHAPLAQHDFDAMWEFPKWTIRTKEIGNASTRVTQCSSGGNLRIGRWNGSQGGGQWHRRQQHNSAFSKMANDPTSECGNRNCAEHDVNSRNTNTSRNNKRTCYHSVLQGYCKSNCIHFKHAREQPNKVNMATALLAAAGNHDLIWLADNVTTCSAASHPAALVIDSRPSHLMCNDHTRFNSIKKHH